MHALRSLAIVLALAGSAQAAEEKLVDHADLAPRTFQMAFSVRMAEILKTEAGQKLRKALGPIAEQIGKGMARDTGLTPEMIERFTQVEVRGGPEFNARAIVMIITTNEPYGRLKLPKAIGRKNLDPDPAMRPLSKGGASEARVDPLPQGQQYIGDGAVFIPINARQFVIVPSWWYKVYMDEKEKASSTQLKELLALKAVMAASLTTEEGPNSPSAIDFLMGPISHAKSLNFTVELGDSVTLATEIEPVDAKDRAEIQRTGKFLVEGAHLTLNGLRKRLPQPAWPMLTLVADDLDKVEWLPEGKRVRARLKLDAAATDKLLDTLEPAIRAIMGKGDDR